MRVRGGNVKHRALRLDAGNFAWASEGNFDVAVRMLLGTTRKTRIIDTVYSPSGNELVRTKTLVKSMIVMVDAVPFRSWYESHYATPLARKKGQKLTPEEEEKFTSVKDKSKKTQKKYADRQKTAAVEPHLLEQFQTGRLLACVSSSPGQCGRCDGYILEGKELEFYLRKIRAKKAK